MRRIVTWVSWLIMAPLFAASVVFALNNKAPVALNLWPFGLVVELPIYLAMFFVLGVGVLIGGIVAWMGQSRVRSNLRVQAYDGEVARRELKAEREKLDALARELNAAKSASLKPASSTPASTSSSPVPALGAQETLPPPQSVN